jgi:hypothetical protein
MRAHNMRRGDTFGLGPARIGQGEPLLGGSEEAAILFGWAAAGALSRWLFQKIANLTSLGASTDSG